MFTGKPLGKLLFCTALVTTLPLAVSAQNIQIDESELTDKTEECRTLATLVQDRDEPFEADVTETIVTAINEDRAEECVAVTDRLQLAASGQDPVDESEELRDQADVQDEAEASTRVREQVDLSEQVNIEGDATVSVPEPNVDVQVPAPSVRVTSQVPQIDVTEDPAQIEVRQAEPQIEVEIPQIVVRVQIPAPELYILQSDPRVEISQADPEVEVAQGEPVVSVTQAEPQLNVDIEMNEDGEPVDGEEADLADNAEGAEGEQRVDGDVELAADEPQVEIVAAEGQPQLNVNRAEPSLSYDGSEPNISVMMAQQPTIEVTNAGEPTIVLETPEEREQRRQQSAEAARTEADPEAGGDNRVVSQDPDIVGSEDPEQAAAEADAAHSGQPGMMMVRDLMRMEVVTADGEDLGSPDAFVEINGEPSLVLSSGGFLGIGQKQVPVPMSRVTLSGEQLVLAELTEDEIDSASDFDYNAELEIPADREIQIAQ